MPKACLPSMARQLGTIGPFEAPSYPLPTISSEALRQAS